MKHKIYHYHSSHRPRPFLVAARLLAAALCAGCLALLGNYLWQEAMRPVQTPPLPPVIPRETPSGSSPREDPLQAAYYEIGTLRVVPERKAYQDGEMELYIPRLGLQTPVLSGVDDETLKRGVGLFDQSQLPGPLGQNGNVSVAGHRDRYGMEFSAIDTLRQGDKVYVTWQGSLYSYEYETTFTTNERDWDPIRVKPYASITMQSGTATGIGSDRVFVIGRLTAVTPDTGFPAGQGPTEAVGNGGPAASGGP